MLISFEQPFKIKITPVHEIDRSRLGYQVIKNIYIVYFAVRYRYERRDIAPQVQKRM